jgi:hypothetical protein
MHVLRLILVLLPPAFVGAWTVLFVLGEPGFDRIAAAGAAAAMFTAWRMWG